MNQPAAPTKLFREEAKTGAIECPACGAPITLRGFGGVEQVACAYCGTICKPDEDNNLDIFQQAQRQRRSSVLPLHKRGALPDEHGGGTWEIIGIVWREVSDYGVTYPWQEFLLFNPYLGYRWLIYQMSDGVWSIGGPLFGAPEIVQGMQPTAKWRGHDYKHFTTGEARVTYVEGEFPWQVLVNDVAQANDYVCPDIASLISIETQHGDDGVDVNFTIMQPIEPAAVWAAFEMTGAPPHKSGIHPAAPNPYKTRFYWISAILLFVVWIVAMVVYAGARADAVVFEGELHPGQVLTQEIDLGDADEAATLEVQLRALGMNNSWAYAEVMVVDQATEEAIGLGLEVDAWSGVSDGESWTEGTNPRTQTLGAVVGGTYVLQATAEVDTKGDAADMLELTIRRDVPLGRYMFLPFLFIIAFPIINFLRRISFEAKRWSNSDHAPSNLTELE